MAKSKEPAGKAVFADEERAAMRERVREQKAAARRGSDRAAGEQNLLAKLSEMGETDRAMGERIHRIITAHAPQLSPTTWYGMPAYEMGGKVVCFFQPAEKFKARYAELGFNDSAKLDDGAIWPTKFALTKLTPAAEKSIIEVVKKAVT